MAQTARPDLSAITEQGYQRSPQKPVSGNPRIGPGKGGTDNAVVVKLMTRPEFDGMSVDSRYRTGSR